MEVTSNGINKIALLPRETIADLAGNVAVISLFAENRVAVNCETRLRGDGVEID